MARRIDRGGFTLIEILVVVSVIGILVVLLVPAVQSARGVARRARCANNLRNIGLAIQNHAEAYGKFPSGGHGSLCNSLFVQILPYIENSALFNCINTNVDATLVENFTAWQHPPGLYFCPSDASRSMPGIQISINYAGNAGRTPFDLDRFPDDGNGVFINRRLSVSDISDGLSQTVGVSEWLVGPGLGNERNERTSKYSLARIYSESAADVEAFARDCKALADVDLRVKHTSLGQHWLEGLSLGTTLYNHTLAPNNHSCYARVWMDATTAGSYHNLTNALTMDGSVHAVKDTIDPAIWTAAGTRAGGETVPPID